MEQTRSTLLSKLANLAEQMLEICRTEMPQKTVKNAAPVRTREEVQEMVAKGLCLNCGNPIAKQPRRGLDIACYTLLKRAVEDGKYTDAELVAAGLQLPKTKGGRPTAKKRRGSGLEEYAKRRAVDVEMVAQEAAKRAEGTHRTPKPAKQ